MSVVVVATIVPKEGRKDELVAIYADAAPRVHDEPGCELYAIHTTRDHVVIIEKWTDMDSLKAHGEGATLAETRPRTKDLQESTEVVVLRPHADASGKGAL